MAWAGGREGPKESVFTRLAGSHTETRLARPLEGVLWPSSLNSRAKTGVGVALGGNEKAQGNKETCRRQRHHRSCYRSPMPLILGYWLYCEAA